MHKKFHLYLSLWIIAFLVFPDLGMTFTAASSSPNNLNQPTNAIISNMTLEEKIGQMLMVGFQGTETSAGLLKTIKDVGPGGLILYRSNIKNPQQTAALISQLQNSSAIPLFIAVDQEGGKVNRLGCGTNLPAALALGAARSPQLAYQAGLATGEELAALGMNVDFAPVLDVLHEPDRSALGSRCFSSDPAMVTNLGLAFFRGLNDAGVIAGVKHFPGHGLAPLDSHLDIPVVEASREQLNTDLQPFQSAFASGAELLMTAHIAYPALDSTRIISHTNQKKIYLPASLSAAVNTDLARQQMGYKGVIVTDSLRMRPIIDHFGSLEEAAVMAVKAGSDLLLIQKDSPRVQKRLLNAVHNGEISEQRINESVQRLLDLKLKRGLISISCNQIFPGTAVNLSLEKRQQLVQQQVGNSAHYFLQQEIAGKAVTLLQNQQRTLPLKLDEGDHIVCFVGLGSMLPAAQESLAEAITAMGLKDVRTSIFNFDSFNKPNTEHLSALHSADHVILFSYGILKTSSASFDPQRKFPLAIAAQAKEYGKEIILITGEPLRDKVYLAAFPALILTYGYDSANISAGLNTAFGIVRPGGCLPVPAKSAAGELLFAPGYGLVYP